MTKEEIVSFYSTWNFSSFSDPVKLCVINRGFGEQSKSEDASHLGLGGVAASGVESRGPAIEGGVSQ